MSEHDEVLAIRAAAAEAVGAAGHLITKVEADARQRARLIKLTAALTGIAFLIASATAWMVFLLLSGRSQTRGVISQSGQALQLLIECTTPGTAEKPHPCHDDGVRNQADAIARINHDSAAQTLEIQACRYQPDVASFRACAAPFIPPLPTPAP